jgi:hypothetical protein
LTIVNGAAHRSLVRYEARRPSGGVDAGESGPISRPFGVAESLSA